MKITVNIGMSSLLLMALHACNTPVNSNYTLIAEAIPVKVIDLHYYNKHEEIHASGGFMTDNETKLSFGTGGIIYTLKVKEGDAVKKGQILASLDQTDLNAKLQMVRMTKEKALRDFERIEKLYTDSVATLEQLQNSKTILEQADQQLKLASFDKTRALIKAPSDGFILKKYANIGQQISPGLTILEFNGINDSSWFLRIAVSDKEWNVIKAGDKAKIQTTVTDKDLDASVCRKSAGVETIGGTFSVDIKFIHKIPFQLATGMFGKAIIKSTQSDDKSVCWQIPYESLLDADNANGYVFITNDNKVAHKVKVKIGSIHKNMVTVTDGLQEARRLIVSGSPYLTDKSAIIIHSTLNETK